MIRGWEWCGTSTRDTRRRLRSRRRPASKFPCHNTYALADSLLITGASQLLTLRGRGPRRGSSLSSLGIIKDGALLVSDGVIAAVGTRAQVEAVPESRAAEKLD